MSDDVSIENMNTDYDIPISTCLNGIANSVEDNERLEYGKLFIRLLSRPLECILNDIQHFSSTLLLIGNDKNECVRTNLIQQIPYIFVRCYELQCTELENNLYDILLDIVLMYLQDSKIQVRKYAFSSITLLLEKYLIDDMRIKFKLCTAIAKLSKVILCDIEQIDIHINAITLMAQLATTIGTENTEEYFLTSFLEMCGNSIYFVRRSCAQNFPIFCQVMGNEKTERELLPTYLKLCEDNIWSVRLAAAESLPIINLMCSDKCKWEDLTPVMLSFLNDSSRWVCRMAFKVLGQFIAAFAKPCITNVAYSRPGNIFITNAANDAFKFESENDDGEENNDDAENEKVENVINSTPIVTSTSSSSSSAALSPSSYYYLSPLSLSLSMSTTSTVWTNSNVQLDYSSKIYDNNSNNDKSNLSRTLTSKKNPYAKFLRELWAIDDISNNFETFDKYKLYFSSTSGNRNFNLYNYHNNINTNSSNNNSSSSNNINTNNEYGTFDDDYDNNNITGKLVDIYDNTSVKDNVITTPKPMLDNENNNNNNNNTTFNDNINNNNNTNINSDSNNNNNNNNSTSNNNNNNNFTINKNKKNKKKKFKLDKNNNNKNINISNASDNDIVDSANDINANTINPMDTTDTTDIIEQNIKVDVDGSTVAAVAAAAAAAAVSVETTGNITNNDVSFISKDIKDGLSLNTSISTTPTINTTTITTHPISSPINIANINRVGEQHRAENLHKIVPIELPSIIKKAIDNKKMQSKFKNNSRIPNALDFNAILQKQSIETPLIENAPQTLDWSNLTNTTNTNKGNDQTLFYDASVTVQPASSELASTAESSVITTVIPPTEPLAVPLVESFAALTIEAAAATSSSSTIPTGTLIETSNSTYTDDNNVFATTLATTTPSTTTSRESIKEILKDFCKYEDDFYDFENEKEQNEKIYNNGGVGGSSSSSGSGSSHNSDDYFNDDNDNDIYNAYQFWHVNPTVDVDMDIIETRSSYNEGVYKMSDGCSISFENKHALEEKNEDVPVSLSMLLKELTTNVGLRNFEQNIVPASLIQCFASMIHYDDPDVNFYCAYNFPAIVFTLGKRNWHLLFKLLRRLCGDIQWKIRKTLASSIYHVALIVGRKIASRDLVPIFVGFLKDLDEIKIEAIRNLKNFLGIIDLNEHFDIIKMLGSCLYTDSATNWRLREDLAQQLYLLLKDYDLSKTDCIIYITGVCLLLLTDKVSTVREIALNAITIKLNRGIDMDVIELLISEFCRNKHWRRRQTFALICEKLIGENVVEPLTYQNMLENLIQLASDTVPNVRLNVAKCLTHDMTVYSSSTYSKLILTLQQLQNDRDRDVQETLHCYFPKITLIHKDDDEDDDGDDDHHQEEDNNNNTDADDANNFDKKSIQVKTTYEN